MARTQKFNFRQRLNWWKARDARREADLAHVKHDAQLLHLTVYHLPLTDDAGYMTIAAQTLNMSDGTCVEPRRFR